MKSFLTFANMSETIRTITNRAVKLLGNEYDEAEIKAIVRVIFEHLTGWDYTHFVINYDSSLDTSICEKATAIINRLQEGEPIQYIIGYEIFMGMKFSLNPSTLIPRPETEELVREIIDSDIKKGSIIDIGSGSGCIAISLAKNMPHATVHGCDISTKAIAQAKKNAELNGVKVDFRQIDILHWEEYHFEKYDAIVSNPPYITEQEKSEMDRRVLAHEPHTALFVPDNKPLLFYERIADFGCRYLNHRGKLWFEINRAYGNECCKMLAERGYSEVKLKQDSYGNDRIVSAIWMRKQSDI